MFYCRVILDLMLLKASTLSLVPGGVHFPGLAQTSRPLKIFEAALSTGKSIDFSVPPHRPLRLFNRKRYKKSSSSDLGLLVASTLLSRPPTKLLTMARVRALHCES